MQVQKEFAQTLTALFQISVVFLQADEKVRGNTDIQSSYFVKFLANGLPLGVKKIWEHLVTMFIRRWRCFVPSTFCILLFPITCGTLNRGQRKMQSNIGFNSTLKSS